MKNILRLLPVFLVVLLSGCKDRTIEKDNLYKFKDYISFVTHGNRSVTTDIRIGLAGQAEGLESGEEIPAARYLDISPKTSGRLAVENGNTLVFQPDKNLKPDTEYTVTVRLENIFPGISKEFKSFTFSFRTIAPNFRVDLGALRSYSKEWQYLEASVSTSDVVTAENAGNLVSVFQNGQKLPLQWESGSDASFFNFRIDSIRRQTEDSEILIRWDGKSILSKNSGEEKYAIPGRNNFKIVSLKSRGAPQAVLEINFSDPLDETQDFSGLVTIGNAENLRFELDGNVLNVYPQTRISGKETVTVFSGIANEDGLKLKENFSETISFEQLKPEVRLLSKGAILPGSEAVPVYFEAVSLSKVDVRVIQIFEKNMLQFLQNYNLDQTDVYDLRRVGRRVAKKTIDLKVHEAEKGNWKAHALDLSELIRAEPGAVYQLELSFKPEYTLYACEDSGFEDRETDSDNYYSGLEQHADPDEEIREQQYWDNEIYSWRKFTYNWQQEDNPCHPAYYNDSRIARTNILGSDLGLTVKRGANLDYHFYAVDLISAEPEAGVAVELYNYQQQLVSKGRTGGDGTGVLNSSEKAAFAIARKGSHYAYVKLDDGSSLSMSNFDISGKKLQRGLKGFLYSERGVYRPGDSIHLTFVLDDSGNPLPENHPVTLSLTDARGKLVRKSVLNKAGSHQREGKSLNGFYYFPIATGTDDPTGNWQATVTVGGAQFEKTLRVASVKPNRLKINLNFDREILEGNKAVTGTIFSEWLHGSPARNLKVDMEATLRSSREAFSGFPGYNFTDPVRSFTEVTVPVVDSELSAEGKTVFSKNFEIGRNAPGMLNATFLTRVFEGGGDFSMDVFTKKIAPFTHFAGLKSPEAEEYGSYHTDSKNVFDVISVDASGKPAAGRNLKVRIYRIEWRWWWDRGDDNLSSYEHATVNRAVENFEITTDSKGKGKFEVNIPDREAGRYLIRVMDEESGHATGRTAYFYKNWWQRPGGENSESAKMLLFTADKEKYNVGETAQITFPSSAGGRALISVENGSEVLENYWVETEDRQTDFSVKLTEAMAPNIYLNISLLQPHRQTKNDLPMRLYGVVPVFVENPATVLEPQIQMPEVLRPETDFTVRVSEKNNRPMTYTIAVVDEGLLDLTRFSTPDIHAGFYSREALGVKTFDMYDYVIGAYSGSVENIYAVGGGDEAPGAKNRKADRFKPVVRFLGPFELGASKSGTHKISMPNYVGSVRTMVVAGNPESAYGRAEKTTPVRTPLMVLASLPRKLSPGERVTLPVTVFAMENKIKQAQISVDAGSALKPVGRTSRTVGFKEPGEKIVNFEFEVLPATAFQTIEVKASGHGERASYRVEIDVENPNPVSQKFSAYKLEPQETRTVSFKTFGVPGSNTAAIEFSTLPPMNFNKRMELLLDYPYGCMEQITSIGFPQLYLADIFDLTSGKKQEIEKNLQAVISRLGNQQLANGGMPYWPGEREADSWSTSYAGHFMLEAKEKGYALPISFLNNWIVYQQTRARHWRKNDRQFNTTLDQAYRLYTLALAGKPELAAMNRLRESGEISNDARWRLAAAYALAGKEKVAREIMQTAHIDFISDKYDYYSYGSPFRNRAMALETMVILGDSRQQELAASIAGDLSSDRWLSTQETGFALLAMGKMVKKSGGKAIGVSYTQNGKQHAVQTASSVAQRDLSFRMGENSVSITNHRENTVYVTLSQKGKLPLGEELVESSKLRVSTRFTDETGKPLDVSALRQGTGILALVSVSNTTGSEISNIALTQIFPSGWEIVNTSFTELEGGAVGEARFIDIRDDRVHFFFDLKKRESRTFAVKLNASFLGTYYLPGAQAEAMYDHSYFARNKGGWVRIDE